MRTNDGVDADTSDATPPPPTTPPPPPPPPPSDGYSIASVTPSATAILVNSSANITFMLNQAATSNFCDPDRRWQSIRRYRRASNCVVLAGARTCTVAVTGLAAGISTVTGSVNGVGTASVVTVTTAGSGGGTQPLSPPVLLSPSASAVFDSTTTTVSFGWRAMTGAPPVTASACSTNRRHRQYQRVMPRRQNLPQRPDVDDQRPTRRHSRPQLQLVGPLG